MPDIIHAGYHVALHCENHPDRRYSCKVVAVNPSGRYNGCRNVFYAGSLVDGEWKTPTPRECECPGSALIINENCRKVLEQFHKQ